MKYDANPLLLSDIWSPAPATRSAVLDINDIIAQDEELKASAPTFVPGALVRCKSIAIALHACG